MALRKLYTALCVLTLLVASSCTDGADPYAPDTGLEPVAAVVTGAACVPSPDVTVASGPELLAALNGATAGDVIAVAGFFDFGGGALVTAADVTLTCLSPGDGVRGIGNSYTVLITVDAPGFSLQGMTVVRDAEGLPYHTTLVAKPTGTGLTVLGSDLACGHSYCVYAQAAGARIEDNVLRGFHTQGAVGLHLADRAMVVGNQMEGASLAVYGQSGTAIAVRGGVGITIADNEVSGWFVGLSLSGYTGDGWAELSDSRFMRNHITARSGGIHVGGYREPASNFHDNTLRANVVEVSWGWGIYLTAGCYNTYEGNRVSTRSAGRVAFNTGTGGNTWRGDPRGVWDGGRADCDGDGVVDPNQIPGSKKP